MVNEKVEAHKKLCLFLNDLYARKNADYGDSFGRSFKVFGRVSAMVRISDKFNRLMSLWDKEAGVVSDEPFRDTLLDMANYCIMLAVEEDGQK